MIKRKHVMEVEAHHFVAFASDLGWSPGHFPQCIDTEIGNRKPLNLSDFDEDGAAHYRQLFGCIRLKVFND